MATSSEIILHQANAHLVKKNAVLSTSPATLRTVVGQDQAISTRNWLTKNLNGKKAFTLLTKFKRKNRKLSGYAKPEIVHIFITLQRTTKKGKFCRTLRTLLLINYPKIGDTLSAERPERVFFRLNDSKST